MLQQLQHITFLKMRMFRKFNSTFCFEVLQWAPGLSYWHLTMWPRITPLDIFAKLHL